MHGGVKVTTVSIDKGGKREMKKSRRRKKDKKEGSLIRRNAKKKKNSGLSLGWTRGGGRREKG